MKQRYKINSDNQAFISSLGEMCAIFRKYKLGLSLKQMSLKTGFPKTTLNGFERGRSSSLRILIEYYKVCENQKQQREFLLHLVEEFTKYRKCE